ncbi:hypothetical protein GCM10027048_28320 [Hymenobacter coalescens]
MLLFYFYSSAARRSLLLLILLLGWSARAQTPSWQAVAPAGVASAGNSLVTATATDAAGNVYLAGEFDGTVVFGGTTLTTSGSTDVFVAKWSSATRGFVWAQRAGGFANEAVTGVAVSGPNVYLVGTFSGTATFGSVALTSSGGVDLFVSKLTDAGSSAGFAWAQRAGSGGYEYAKAVAVSGSHVYVAGYFSSATASFGSIDLPNADPWGASYDVFVARLTDAGTTASFAWATRAGAAGSEQVEGLAASGNEVYLAGTFQGATASFGATTLTNAGTNNSPDVFVAKLLDGGTSGAFAWARQAGGGGSDLAHAVATHGGEVYVTGGFSSATAAFGPTVLANTGSGISPGADVFVTKLTAAGAFAWTVQAGSPDDEMARSLAVLGPDVYLTGYFGGRTSRFGSTVLTNTSTGGYNDVFVAKLTDAGPAAAFVWALQAGGTGGDFAGTVAASGRRVFVTGVVTPPATFGTLTLPGSSPSGLTAFLATINDEVLAAAPATALPTLSVFPNPAHSTATVQLPALSGATTLVLMDAQAREVYRQQVRLPALGTVKVPVHGLPAGMYQVRVQTGSQLLTCALMVQ